FWARTAWACNRRKVSRSAQSAPALTRGPFPCTAGVNELNRLASISSTLLRPPRQVRPVHCPVAARKEGNVAQRIVEVLIGRLITDEQFRAAFLEDPEGTLVALGERGLELTGTEIAALVSTDPAVWVRAAELLDPRLQKASLVNQPSSQKESEQHV
ncbi:MAG TPA: Os1348 family NHLP clan protein, partial [Vicinamibacterales bacterium]|nr:Os1348 family NHLP clan protein [Vicinamibacterales bacterium]